MLKIPEVLRGVVQERDEYFRKEITREVCSLEVRRKSRGSVYTRCKILWNEI